MIFYPSWGVGHFSVITVGHFWVVIRTLMGSTHLSFSLSIGTTGSHVPHKSLDQVRATFMPDAAQAVSRSLLHLSWSSVSPQL